MYRYQIEDFEYSVLEDWLTNKANLQKELSNGNISPERKEHLTTILTAIDKLQSKVSDTHRKIIELLYFEEYYPEEVADEIGYRLSRLNSSKKIILQRFAAELGWINPF